MTNSVALTEGDRNQQKGKTSKSFQLTAGDDVLLPGKQQVALLAQSSELHLPGSEMLCCTTNVNVYHIFLRSEPASLLASEDEKELTNLKCA